MVWFLQTFGIGMETFDVRIDMYSWLYIYFHFQFPIELNMEKIVLERWFVLFAIFARNGTPKPIRNCINRAYSIPFNGKWPNIRMDNDNIIWLLMSINCIQMLRKLTNTRKSSQFAVTHTAHMSHTLSVSDNWTKMWWIFELVISWLDTFYIF